MENAAPGVAPALLIKSLPAMGASKEVSQKRSFEKILRIRRKKIRLWSLMDTECCFLIPRFFAGLMRQPSRFTHLFCDFFT